MLLFSLSVICAGTLASDQLREQKNALDIKESLDEGKAITLKAGDQEFLAIHEEPARGEVRGAAILLHGMGGDPAWSVVVQPLRTGLTKYGWETLSLQMPVAPSGAEAWAYDALIPEAAPRISAAIEFLRQRKIKKIVIIGHSMGARMGLEAVAAGVPKEVIAFVAIGAPTNKNETEAGVLGAIGKIKLPIFDLYGSRDLPNVLGSADARLRAARQAENSNYTQVKIPGADHFFLGLEDGLLDRVGSWISKQAAESKDSSEEESKEGEQQQKNE